MRIKVSIIDDNDDVYEGEITLDKTKSSKQSQRIGKSEDSGGNLERIGSKNRISINTPEKLMVEIDALDDREKIPILWYFSNQPIMTISDFLDASIEKGYSLNSSWHTSAGGHFKSRLVKDDKMFADAHQRSGKEKMWKLTDIGILKIKKKIKDIQK